MVIIGGALLFAFAFYHKAWVSLAWFGTNSVLWLIGAGGIVMFVIGAGLFFLLAGPKSYETKLGFIFRIVGYGFLMVKPQCGLFIVVIFILVHKDWKGLLISIFVFGLIFAPLYPNWLHMLLTDPPASQNEAAHSLWGKFGPVLAIPIAISVILSRRWKYWQLGGALAGILPPYAMPGIPVFLMLTSVQKLASIPAIVIFSGCLAVLTWVTPSHPVSNIYQFISPFMAIYHLGMIGLTLIMACLLPASEPDEDGSISIDVTHSLKTWLNKRRL